MHKRHIRGILPPRKRSDYPTLPEFLIHFVVKRRTNADVPDLLDLAADSVFAPGTSDEICDATYGERQQRGNAKEAETDAKAAARAGVHEVTHQKSCGSTENHRSSEGTAFHPNRSRINMRISHGMHTKHSIG